MANRSVDTVVKTERALAAGLRAHLATAVMMINGARVSGAQLASSIEAHLALIEQIRHMRYELLGLVARQKKLLAANDAARRVVMSYVVATYGANSKELTALGFKVKKRKKLTVAQRVAATAKSLATRKARHTMGKKQRKAIKAPTS